MQCIFTIGQFPLAVSVFVCGPLSIISIPLLIFVMICNQCSQTSHSQGSCASFKHFQQKPWPFPHSTLIPCFPPSSEAPARPSLFNTACPQSGKGHHLMSWLISTKCYNESKKNYNMEQFTLEYNTLNDKIIKYNWNIFKSKVSYYSSYLQVEIWIFFIKFLWY